MNVIVPDFGSDYELIDTGDFQKLERFGSYVLQRPEPQALWRPALSPAEWEKAADAIFRRAKTAGAVSEKGEWVQKPNMPGQWFVNFRVANTSIKMRLGLTAFKHVGLFPEQIDNWRYIYEAVANMGENKARVLNLFAYTGGASLAAAAAGADVTHLDSVKQVLNWTKQNMEASGLDNIRWVCEDAMKFLTREAKRGNQYRGIILDPPAYGRGPEGEKWQLEENIGELLHYCKAILERQKGSFLVLNLYSMGFSALIAHNLLSTVFSPETLDSGELAFADKAGRQLPLGVYARFTD